MADQLAEDRAAKAVGRFPYANDLRDVDEVHGAVVRSGCAHAKILGVDASAATARPDVLAVFTADDIPGSRRVGALGHDQRVLAEGRIRHAGEPVAFVVATTRTGALDAARSVVVHYEPLPPVADAAAAASAPAEGSDEPGSLLAHHVVRRGVPTETDVSVTGQWSTGRQDPAFLAPEAATAEPWAGGVRMWVATQDLHADRDAIAAVLGLPPEVVAMEDAGIGGAFGGREELTVQPLVALAALRLGRRVSCRLDSAQSLLAHPTRHPSYADVTIGADADGTLRTVFARVVLDGGPYLTTSSSVARIVAYAMGGPYRFDAVDIEVRVGRTTNPTAGALRGFGATQACFALESTLDLLADRLGMDPVDLRLRNAAGRSDRLATSGQPLGPATPVAEVIRRAQQHPSPPLDPPAAGVRRASAVAVGLKHCLRGDGRVEDTWAALTLSRSGLVAETAAVDVGQGLRAVVQRTVERELGITAVRVETPDVRMGRAGPTSASRQTWLVSGAVRACCLALAEEIRQRTGSSTLRFSGERVLLDDGAVPLHVLAAQVGPVHVERPFSAHPTEAGDPEDGTGEDVHVAFMYSAHRATVDLHPDGAVNVLHVVAVHDAGVVVDELSALRRVEGGVIQGIGFALYEAQVLDESGAHCAPPGWEGYPVPSLAEVPPIDVVFVESHEPRHPFGVKGLGESPLVASPTAVALAIGRASGNPVTSIPLAPGGVPRWYRHDRAELT